MNYADSVYAVGEPMYKLFEALLSFKMDSTMLCFRITMPKVYSDAFESA